MSASRRLQRRRQWVRRTLTVAVALLALAWLAHGPLSQIGVLPGLIRRGAAPFPLMGATREGRWRQDVLYLAAQLPARHRDAFFQTPETTFRAQAAALEAAVPASDDVVIMLGMAALAASLGDGHTSVELADPQRLHTFPLRLTWLGDDLVVIGAHADYGAALGARVTHVGATPIAAALDAVTPFIAHDNAQQLRALSPGLLLTPEILAALRILPDAPIGRFQLETAEGEALVLEVTPVRADMPFEEVTIDEALAITPPLRMQGGSQPYWYSYLAESRTIYFHYRRCVDDPQRPFTAFNRELFALIDSQPVERLIIDLRFNGGGDSRVLRPFIAAVQQRPALNQQGRLYVLIGAQTFSSALMNAIELRDGTHSILLGEPTGGKPNAYGEVRSFRLPNAGLRVQYSTRYHTNLPGSDAPSLRPDLLYPLTWSDLLTGADPAVEAAMGGVLPPGEPLR